MDLRPTLRAGSDEYIEFICNSCIITKNHRVEAKGHCKECLQNICYDCIQCHKNIAVLKNHVIENKPKVTSGQGAGKAGDTTNPLTDHCSTHPEELIKFVCNVHQTLACSDCLSLGHRNCEDVSYIRDISSNITDSHELKTLQYGLETFEETINVYKATSESIQTQVIKSADNVVDQIKQWRVEMNALLDELENELLKKTSDLRTDSISRLTEASSACDDLITETKRFLDDLEDKRKLGHNNRLFISVKQSRDLLSRMQQQADRIGEQCKPRRLSFYRHEKVATMLSTLGLGTISLSGGDPADIQAKYEREISIKATTDTMDCVINGFIVLSDGRLCLCDYNNKSIKLIDTKFMKISDQLTLSAEPKDTTQINNQEIAILIKGDKNLHILSVSPKPRPSRIIPLPDIYNGIAYCEDKLLLTWWKPNDNYGGIDICDIKGNRIKQIETHVDGTKIFTSTYRICVSPDHSMMYVTDYGAHTVVCMNMDGDVINVYRNEKLKAPRGITVDQDGNVYVSSAHTHMIHQLSRTGLSVKILLNDQDGLEFPKVIVYMSGHLYISSSSTTPARCNNIKVFRLSYKK